MKLRFFGTSSGTPTLSRNVSGLALQPRQSREWYLVDCGEATQHQILRSDLSLAKLQAIFITHVHGDHCYGLPGLLASAGLAGRTEPLALIAPRPVAGLLQAVREFTDLHLPFEIQFHAVDEMLPGETLWQDERVGVTAHELSHRVPCFAYAFTEVPPAPGLDEVALQALGVPRGPLWGRLQHGEPVDLPCGTRVEPGQVRLPTARAPRVVVAGDNDTPSLLAAASPADVWVHEATYTEDILLKVGPGTRHSSAARVAQAAQADRVPHLVLTHFSPRYRDDPTHSPSLADVEAEARSRYDGELFLARDGDVFELGASGKLCRGTPVLKSPGQG